MKIFVLLLTLIACAFASEQCSAFSELEILTMNDGAFAEGTTFSKEEATSRQIGWFTNRLLLAYNQQFITDNKAVVQKVYPCCMAFFITNDGQLYKNDNDQFITWYTSPYVDMGIQVHPVITSQNSTAMALAYNNANTIAGQMVQYAKTFGFTGYVFDYEGNAQDSVAYAQFLNTVGTFLNNRGVTLATTIADWGALSNYSAYANIAVNNFIQMGTYSPPFVPSKIDNAIAFIPPAKFEMGLSTFHASPTYTWNCTALQQAVAYARLRGIEKIGVWWAPNSPAEGDIQPFFMTQLSQFSTVMC